MKIRKVSDEDGSLDLLLDTVCNAFGGIVFITLLVCILPTNLIESTQSSSHASDTEMLELQQARNQLALKEKVLLLLNNMAQGFENPEAKKELSELLRLKDREREAREMSKLLDIKTLDFDKEINDSRLQMERLGKLHEKLEMRLLQMGDELRNRKDIRLTRLPRIRKVNKKNFFIVLSGEKIYLVRRPGTHTLEYQYNEIDFDVKSFGNQFSLKPHPSKGSVVKEWLISPDGALRLMGQVSNRRYLIYFIVYPDSLPHFSSVRNFFTTKGFDYNWSPLAAGKSLRLILSSGPMDAQ